MKNSKFILIHGEIMKNESADYPQRNNLPGFQLNAELTKFLYMVFYF